MTSRLQQSFNQMLATAGIAGGLYSHSPEGQKQAQIRTKKTELKGIESKLEEGLGSTADEQKAATLSQEIFNLQPNAKNLDIETVTVGRWQKRVQELEKHKATMKTRKELLSNAPKSSPKRTIVEVNANV